MKNRLTVIQKVSHEVPVVVNNPVPLCTALTKRAHTHMFTAALSTIVTN